MKTVNSLSGGKTSSYLAVHYPADYNVFSLVCIDNHKAAPKDKAVVDYVNGKLEKFHSLYGPFIATAEDDKTLTTMMDLEQYIGREITWVRGISFNNLIRERYERVLLGNRKRLPSWARRYCTEEMKLVPIFLWWFKNIGEKVNMRIGFRFDEFDRMERFFNKSNPTQFKIPVSCNTYGRKLQNHQTFNWRHCSFPLIRDGITENTIKDYWKENGVLKQTLFKPERKIEFPVVSNCIGCFHKKVETLAAMAELHPNKFDFFVEQELLGMGTWLDSRQTYQNIKENRFDLAKELIFEISELGQSCDTGGCTD